MSKMRYGKDFKKAMFALCFCFLLFGGMLIYSVIAQIQYSALTQQMLVTNATVTDVARRSRRYCDIQISYEVNGETYRRELDTDTPISFDPGRRPFFREGDVIEIFYHPEDPMQIASAISFERAVGRSIFASVFLALTVFSFVFTIKWRERLWGIGKKYRKT